MKLNSRNIFSFTLLLFVMAMLSGSDISITGITTSHLTKNQQVEKSTASKYTSSPDRLLMAENDDNGLVEKDDSKSDSLQAYLHDLTTLFFRSTLSIKSLLPNVSYSTYSIPLYILYHSVRIPFSAN